MSQTQEPQTPEPPAHPLIESDRVEGTTVYSKDGQYIGSIKRLMIEKVSGQVVYAVVVFGRHFGLGGESHIIPWPKLTYDRGLGGYHTDVTEDELRDVPDFSKGENRDPLDREAEEELHAYYRIPPYWRGF